MDTLKNELMHLTEEEGIRYFYHFTSADGDKILNEGLFVASFLWQQSFLEFTLDELLNIENVINDNKSNKIKINNTMIIAGVYEDDINNFIRKASNDEICPDFEGVDTPDYIVDPNYIIGYIDLNNLELKVNEYASVLSDNLYL